VCTRLRLPYDPAVELAGHLDLLDRQAEFLRRVTDDREFLVAVPTLLVQLYGDVVVRDVLTQLDADGSAAIEDYKKVAGSVGADLRRLAEDFASRTPSHESEIDKARVAIERLRALEDHSLPLDPTQPFELPLDAPLQALEQVRLATAQDVRFRATADRLVPIYEQHNHAKRTLTLRAWTEAAFSLVRLRSVADLINPKSSAPTSRGDYPRAIGLGGVIDRYVFGPQQENIVRADAAQVASLADRARVDAERLLLEVRRRLTVRQSRLVVVRRFQTWAQWYSRDDLRAVIEHSGKSKKRRQIEDDLTRELARFLFTEGLDPLSQPLLNRVKPDLLDSSERGRLYVEAKWAESSAEALEGLAQGVRQTLDTAILLVGTVHRLDEAFVVLFLGGGQRVDAPASIAFAELTVRIAIVDLAPWETIASRRKKSPLILADDEIVSRVENLPPNPDPDAPLQEQ
jgi:hypothetical protein